jgi:hypothetical protein
MRTAILAGCLLWMGAAWAAPRGLNREAAGPADDEVVPDRASGGVSEEPLKVVESAKATSCKSVCFQPGARTTVLVEAQPVAATKPVATPPQFRRAAAVAAAGETPRAETSMAWTLDVAAQLKKAAVSGNTLFVFFDMADPNSVKENATSALFQAPVKAGRTLAAHLSLSPEDGFHAGHTYRLRIAQLLGGREVVLVESDFTLL